MIHGLFFVTIVQAHILHPKWLCPPSFPVANHAENVYNSETLCWRRGVQWLMVKEEVPIFNAIRANDPTERIPLTHGSNAGYAFS